VQADNALAKTTELALVAPQVIMLRTARMLAAGSAPGARDRREISRMGAEKLQAAHASMLAMSAQMYRISLAWTLQAAHAWWSASLLTWSWMRYPGAMWRPGTPGLRALENAALQVMNKGLAPVHAAATANLRRLSRNAAR
jgi:hypothetical protein